MTKKAAGLWTNLERFSTPAAVLAEWQVVLGADFENFRNFLRATDELALEYPCTNRPACGCRHEVVPLRMVAACRCEPRDCESIALEPKDVLVHALNTRKFCAAIRGVLGFEAPPDENAVIDGTRGTWPVGTYRQTRSPVFLTMRLTEAEFVAELERLIRGAGEPFVLLAPTEQHKTAIVQGILQRERCAFVPLSACLALDGPGRFAIMDPVTNPTRAILDRFSARLAEGSGLVKTVEKIGRDIEAVVKRDYEQNKEIENLHRLAADGYLNFIRSVDPRDFCCFAFIMAYGDRAKAARELEMPARRFYERVGAWETRGPGYKRMFDLVTCRKQTLLKGTVPLSASLQSGGVQKDAENPEALGAVLEQIRAGNLDQRDYPQVLQEILSALADMNVRNWPAIRDEVMAILREEIAQ